MVGDKMGRSDVRLHLSPEDKVSVAIEMTNACVRVSADGIRNENPGISDEELLRKLRERLSKSIGSRAW